MHNSFAEVTKLQKHLALLREEYVKLQTKYEDLSRKYEIVTASSSQADGEGFVFRLLSIISQLYNKPQYRWDNWSWCARQTAQQILTLSPSLWVGSGRPFTHQVGPQVSLGIAYVQVLGAVPTSNYISFLLGHIIVQSCLLIIFQYQPISLQYSWLSVEQPFRFRLSDVYVSLRISNTVECSKYLVDIKITCSLFFVLLSGEFLWHWHIFFLWHSDITINVGGESIKSHKFVLKARSDHWTSNDLETISEINMPSGRVMLAAGSLFSRFWIISITFQATERYMYDNLNL